ncbi:MAG: phosphate signaling complex protein PhoU [Spirochaetales bacterium]|nr:phosphate signaling complex protein PhoU [Spirochaetales bacterium]
MRKKFDEQLDDLSQEMIYMGNLIEQAIENAVDALIHKNVEKAENIINSDDKIDNQERKIESLCLHLLLQQQPVAKDLRLISSTLKMITDMERIGDHATDIAELTIEMANQPYIKKLEHIEQMAKEIILMLINCLKAYVTRDVLTAENVIKHDDKVDKLFYMVKKDLIQMIHENYDYGEQASDLLLIAKYFERIGDHTTNIAEWIIFSVTGKHEKIKDF